MISKIKNLTFYIFICIFIAALVGCSNPNTDQPEDNSYKLIEFNAQQSTTTPNAVTVTWKDSFNYDKYYIYYNTTNDSSTAKKTSGSGYVSVEYDSSYNKTGFYKGSKDVALSEAGTYYFWIKAVDGNNKESEFSKSTSCVFTPVSLSTPIDVSAVQSETSYNTITVTWRDTSEAYKYYIYYNTIDDSSTAKKASGNGYASDEYDSSYKKTGYYKGSKDVALSEAGTYYFWVKAVDGNNKESDFSKSTSCTFTPTSLTAPIDVSAAQSETSYNNVTVSWRDSSEAYKYVIYYNTTNDSSTATKASGSGYVSVEYDSKYNKTGFYKGSKDVALAESGTYYFWVKAVDGNKQESEFSSVSEVVVFTAGSLNAPVNVVVTKSTETPNKVVITWKDSKEANKYYIYYNTTNDSSTATKVSGSGYVSVEYDSNYNKTGLYKGSKEISLSESGTYYFWIKGLDGNNKESEFSETVSFIFD